MQVKQLAAESDLSVYTIRYYQKRGLLHSPQRLGRVAEYDHSHVSRLAEIQHLSQAGFTLAQIERLSGDSSQLLLRALDTDGETAGTGTGETTLSLAQLAAASGLDQAVCEVALAAGLITAIGDSASPGTAKGAGKSVGKAAELRFSPSAAEMLKVGVQLLEAGIPLEDLLAIASFHAANIDKVAESAVSLFADYLLHADEQPGHGDAGDAAGQPADLGDLVERLVPLVTNLVAQHFQRTLVDKATQRFIEKASEGEAGAGKASEAAASPSAPAPIILQRFEVAPELDPLTAFTTATDYQRTYWTVPNDDLEIAAIGSAATLAVAPSADSPSASGGPERFTDVDAALQKLNVSVEGEPGPAITGPLLLGGFSFTEPAEPNSAGPNSAGPVPDWSAFGDGDLTLPEILIVRNRGKTFVTAAPASVDRAHSLVAQTLAQQAPDQLAAAPVAPPTASSTPPTATPPTATPTSPTGRAHDSADHAANPAFGDSAHDPTYLDLVTQALADIDAHLFTKVVTARMFEQPCSVSQQTLLDRLRQRYQSCAVFAFCRGEQTFLGASPELLIRLEGAQVKTDALAGSRPRGAEPAQDSALSVELLTSTKERAEHRLVAQAIRETLTNAGIKLAAPTEPVVMTLPAIQHLHTQIDGGAQAHTRVLDLVAALHPTPAVSGAPRTEAMQWISQHEKFDRGWYAAPIGWTTPAGSGEFRVALRCALLTPTTMTLFAGGGIVAGTNAQAELAETATKFEALLSVSQPEELENLESQRA